MAKVKIVTKKYIIDKKNKVAFEGCVIEEHDLGDKIKFVLRNDELNYRAYIYIDKKYDQSTFSLRDLLEAYKMDKYNHVKAQYRKAGYLYGGSTKVQTN